MTSPAAARIRVGVIDDHAVVRDGTAALLDREPDFEVVGVADTIASAATLLDLGPDVLVLDVRLGKENGLDLLVAMSKARNESGPGRKAPAVVILSAFQYPQFVEAAVRLGASGYVLKTDPIERLIDAIRQVAAGGVAYSVRPAADAVTRPTARELDVIRLVVEGRSNDEIASRLGLSPKTIGNHLSRLFERLDAGSRTELATRALREGWLEDAPR